MNLDSCDESGTGRDAITILVGRWEGMILERCPLLKRTLGKGDEHPDYVHLKYYGIFTFYAQ